MNANGGPREVRAHEGRLGPGKHDDGAVDVLAAVKDYAGRGWSCIPIPYGSKRPGIGGWQHLRLGVEDAPRYFQGAMNVGVLCGEPSEWLVDVDADVPEAVAAAAEFLPPTRLVHGRPGNPGSHYWFVTTGPIETAKYQFVEQSGDKPTMLVELRSTGCQTVLPPSVYLGEEYGREGERLRWESAGDPGGVAPEELAAGVAKVGACALLARHWPGEGSRDDAAMALTGMLLRAGWSVAEADHFVTVTARIAGDEEWRERAKGKHSAQELEASRPVTGTARLRELLRDGERIVPQVRRWLGIRADVTTLPTAGGTGRGDTGGEESGGVATSAKRPPSQAALLLALVDGCGAELFHDHAGKAYATVPVAAHWETWALASNGFSRWLRHQFYLRTGKAPNAQALQEVRGVLEGQAIYRGETRHLWMRVAEHEGALYVDLCDATWRAVEITPRGWQIVGSPPVRFRRTPSMQPLPSPAAGGTLDSLRRFVNVRDDDWPLLAAWLVSATRPHGPYPLLNFQGQQGSAKTTTARVLRALIDPNAAPVRAEPREARDLAVAANNAWAVVFDNLSRLPQWLSDALCRLSTGGAMAVRALYTDDEEAIFHAVRPVILTGIEEVITASDLLDRTMLLTLPAIPEESRQPEATFWAAFERDRPALLGALCDAVAGAMRHLPEVRLERLPRMADFALWAAAAEMGQPGLRRGAFIAAYTKQRQEADQVALDASPVATALIKWWREWEEAHPCGAWEGSSGVLLELVAASAGEEATRKRSWPKSPRGLSGQLDRVAPNMRTAGIALVRLPRAADGRRWRIERTGAGPTRPSQPSPPIAQTDRDAGRADVGRRSSHDGGHDGGDDQGEREPVLVATPLAGPVGHDGPAPVRSVEQTWHRAGSASGAPSPEEEQVEWMG